MRIAVLDDYQDVALTMADWSPVLARAGVDTFTDHVVDPDALVERLRPYEVVVLMRERTPMPAEVIDRLPALTLVVSTGRRNPSIDLDALRRRGIPACATDSPITAPGELTWALILGLARNLVTDHQSIRDGGWQTTVGSDLADRTLGLVGLGRIGSHVARVAVAFGMRVLAWSPHLDDERAAAAGATAVPFERLLSESDVVSVHVPLNDGTRGLLGATELALMKPSALLVNTSRGPIVDETALLDALASGRVGGAGLDVFDEEPLPIDHPLRTAPRTLLTPHTGYVTEATYRVFFEGVVEDIVAWLGGKPIREM
jgi:phosphoglycerate dehydrogenase-like enzyme